MSGLFNFPLARSCRSSRAWNMHNGMVHDDKQIWSYIDPFRLSSLSCPFPSFSSTLFRPYLIPFASTSCLLPAVLPLNATYPLWVRFGSFGIVRQWKGNFIPTRSLRRPWRQLASLSSPGVQPLGEHESLIGGFCPCRCPQSS